MSFSFPPNQTVASNSVNDSDINSRMKQKAKTPKTQIAQPHH